MKKTAVKKPAKKLEASSQLKKIASEAGVKDIDNQLASFVSNINFCCYVLEDFLDRKLITPTQNKECQKLLQNKLKAALK